MKRLREEEEEEEEEEVLLVPDVIRLIFATVREADFAARARLRCVCRTLYEADEAFVVPAWVHTHPGLKTLPDDVRWVSYLKGFIEDACRHEAWARIPYPESLEWLTCENYGAARLRVKWPDLLFSKIYLSRWEDDGTMQYKQGCYWACSFGSLSWEKPDSERLKKSWESMIVPGSTITQPDSTVWGEIITDIKPPTLTNKKLA